jgi:hypothetical protein
VANIIIREDDLSGFTYREIISYSFAISKER